MDNDDGDMNTALMVDGNAVGGQLEQIFRRDMTMRAPGAPAAPVTRRWER